MLEFLCVAKATMNEDLMESFKAMARAVRKQAIVTTLMAQQRVNENGNGHGNGHGDEYLKFA